MTPYAIAINSLGRAGKIRTLEALGVSAGREAILFVEEAELELYRAAYPKHRIESVPDGSKLQRSRNLVLERLGAEAEAVIIIDDDFTQFRRRLSDKPADVTRSTKAAGADVIAELLRLLDRGYALASISFTGSNYLHPEPFEYDTRVSGIIAARPAILAGAGIRYDEAITDMEDYDLVAQVLYAGLHSARSYRFMFDTVSLGTNPGGCQTYRTIESSSAASRYLQAKWGPDVVRLVNKHGRTEVQFQWKRLAREARPL